MFVRVMKEGIANIDLQSTPCKLIREMASTVPANLILVITANT